MNLRLTFEITKIKGKSINSIKVIWAGIMNSIWQDVLKETKSFVKQPERFLDTKGKDEDDFEKSKILLKVLYDASKTDERDNPQALRKTLPELIINEFDEEQVWTAIELQNELVKDDCVSRLQRLICLPDHALTFAPDEENEHMTSEEEEEDNLPLHDVNYDVQDEMSDEDEEDVAESEDISIADDKESEASEDNDDPLNDPDFQNMSDSDLDDKLPLFDKTDSEDSEKEEEKEEAKEAVLDSQTEDYMSNAMQAIKNRGSGDPNSVTEDKFFKLDEMEKFLDDEDSKAMRDVTEDNDDEIDYFASDDDDGDDNDAENVKTMYKDFFEKKESNADVSELKKDILDGDDEDHLHEYGEPKSTHEMRTMRLQKKIEQLETEAVASKPWQLTGEVAAIERPDNALLEEDLDFETVTKQAPVITEEVSRRLEDIIKQRIKDQSWDDVERKVKPVDNPYDYKKKLILDQEKSKLSLAQVYEEEYLQQKGDLDATKRTPGSGMLEDMEEDKPESLDEIKRRMKELFTKLDVLTHYHYTPHAVNAEVKIVRNLPTIGNCSTCIKRGEKLKLIISFHSNGRSGSCVDE